MTQDQNASPFNPLPAIVWLLALPVIAMEIVVSLGARGLAGGPQAVGWRLDAVERFGFVPDLMRRMIALSEFPPAEVARLVTYPLVHANLTHAVFVVVMLLALGKMVGEVFRAWAVLAIVFGASVAGALAYMAIPTARAVLVGGYPAVYGLIGAFTFLLWVRLAARGANQYRAFTLIGMLMAIQLVFGVLFGGSWHWVAEIAGFAAGFLLSFVVSPGGWGRVVDRLRQR